MLVQTLCWKEQEDANLQKFWLCCYSACLAWRCVQRGSPAAGSHLKARGCPCSRRKAQRHHSVLLQRGSCQPSHGASGLSLSYPDPLFFSSDFGPQGVQESLVCSPAEVGGPGLTYRAGEEGANLDVAEAFRVPEQVSSHPPLSFSLPSLA